MAHEYILGLSAYYHDSAACLLRDGEIVAAAQEERFSRKKGDERFPRTPSTYCLREAGITMADVGHVGFYDKPLLKFERILETYLAVAPRGFRSFLMAGPLWVKEKLFTDRELRKALGGYEGLLLYAEHHESHAASAFFPSPFEEAAILTIDGVGEWATASIGVGQGQRPRAPRARSAGPTRSACSTRRSPTTPASRSTRASTRSWASRPTASRGTSDLIYKHWSTCSEDGSFTLDLKYFDYLDGLTMTNAAFDELFGGPPRMPETNLTQREMDLARSVQVVTEEIMLRMARTAAPARRGSRTSAWRAASRSTASATAGCCARGRSSASGSSPPPATPAARSASRSSSGTATCKQPRAVTPGTRRDAGRLPRPGVRRRRDRGVPRDDRRVVPAARSRRRCWTASAELLASEKIVGWFKGRMEFGPRALGCRSILGDPRSPRMQAQMNLKIKFREGFRPFAPSVLREHVSEYFELDCDSPYMLLVAPVKQERQIPMTDGAARSCGASSSSTSPRSDIPGRHAHRLLGAHPDGEPRDEPGLLRSDQRVPATARAARSSSTRRSTCAASRSSARRRTRTGASCARTSTASCSVPSCSRRPARPNGRRTRHGSASSSSIDRGRGPQVRVHRRRRLPRLRRDRALARQAAHGARCCSRSAGSSSLAALVAPTALGPVERAWMGLAHAISRVTTPDLHGHRLFSRHHCRSASSAG